MSALFRKPLAPSVILGHSRGMLQRVGPSDRAGIPVSALVFYMLFMLLGTASVVGPSLHAQPLGGAAKAEYQVGERGPAGGVIFLVSVNESGERRYVEAAPEDIKGFVDPDTAAGLAQEYRGGGFSDWRLPSSRELNEMYTHRNLIGGLSADWYWSSSREPAYGVRYQHLGHGSQGYSRYELFNYRVRPVREF